MTRIASIFHIDSSTRWRLGALGVAVLTVLGVYALTTERSAEETQATEAATGAFEPDDLEDSKSILGLIRASSSGSGMRLNARGDEFEIQVDEQAFREFAEEAMLTPEQRNTVLSHYRRYARHLSSLRKTGRIDLVERLEGHIQALILSGLTDSQAESFRQSNLALAQSSSNLLAAEAAKDPSTIHEQTEKSAQ